MSGPNQPQGQPYQQPQGQYYQQQPQPQPPPPAPRGGSNKSKMIIIIAVAVVAVVVVAVLALVLMGGLGGGGGGSSINWKVNDYVEYTWETTSGGDTIRMVMEEKVNSVSSTQMEMKITTTVFINNVAQGSPSISYETMDKSSALGGNVDVNDPPVGTTIVKMASETVSTKWGGRLCDHYQVTELGDTAEFWIYKGVVMKMDITIGGTSATLVLSNTNLSAVTG